MTRAVCVWGMEQTRAEVIVINCFTLSRRHKTSPQQKKKIKIILHGLCVLHNSKTHGPIKVK